MHYVSVEGLTKSYGIKPLFGGLYFHIEEGDKIALVARNGSGKSTLLQILAGKEIPDEGKVWINKDVDIALLEQEPQFQENKTILDNIFFHDHPVINAIKEYEAISEEGNAEKLGASIIKMDQLGAWDFDARVKQILGKLNIHQLQQPVGTLSGGQRKRVALAKTLIDIGFDHKHVLLIMDEPTNHLDVEMVEWLEHYLNKESITLLLVSHDRYFLDAVCNEIWELTDGPDVSNNKLFVYKGDYENYLEKKALRIENETANIDKAKNLYRKELEWMLKQPRARTTKSKSRVEAFSLVEANAKRRIQDQQMQLQAKMSRLGGKVIELKNLHKSYGEKVILKGFDYTFKKGERVGIVGKNAVGKSTFVNIIQDLERPDGGKVNIGETVIFGNYSQQGLQVKEDVRVIEFVKNIAENFPLANGGSLSASQFLELFLFNPDQQYTYISKLSGGEKRRLHLLSILFRNPNFLILDEPTNDLDLPTLGVLENFLGEFQGCLVVVSHDRYFMDRLVDHLFVFEGDGAIEDFPGNYSEYRLWKKGQEELPDTSYRIPVKPDVTINYTRKGEDLLPATGYQSPVKGDAMVNNTGNRKPVTGNQRQETGNQKRKLSYKEKRELELLDKEIADLSREKEQITLKLNSGNTPFEELNQLSTRIGEVTTLLDEKELRWLALSELAE